MSQVKENKCLLTRLNCPRKKGPSSNFEKACSMKSNAAAVAIANHHYYHSLFQIEREMTNGIQTYQLGHPLLL